MADLPRLLRPGDVLVVNDTRVLAARLALAKPTGGRAEVLLLEPRAGRGDEWEALVRPGRRLPPGTPLVEPGGRRARWWRWGRSSRRVATGPGPAGSACSTRTWWPRSVPAAAALHRHDLADPERYQTVYAADAPLTDRSAAAPTAGLHFTAGPPRRHARRRAPRWPAWTSPSGSTPSDR